MDAGLSVERVSENLLRFLRSEIVAPGVEFDARTPLRTIGLDSISFVQMILFIERHHGVSLSESLLTAENLESVAALARRVCAVHNAVCTSLETTGENLGCRPERYASP